jgi:hypothetical protein
VSDHSLRPTDEKHSRDAKIWGIMIIASAALLLVSGFFVKSVEKETLPETKTLSPGQVRVLQHGPDRKRWVAHGLSA